MTGPARPADDPPAGFVRFSLGGARVVCAAHVEDAVRSALGSGTLHQYAERHPSARPLAGRGVAYLAPLPGDVERVVVRHNRHGGLLAGVTGDLFLRPTRAARELAVSERLRAAGVPTPEILGYALYPAGAVFARVDVMSRAVEDSFDLSAVLMSADGARRDGAWRATRHLLDALSKARAWHQDLNVKNILLRQADGGLEAMVLDVDRVEFTSDAGRARGANLARLMRSARKWQRERNAPISDRELNELAATLGA